LGYTCGGGDIVHGGLVKAFLAKQINRGIPDRILHDLLLAPQQYFGIRSQSHFLCWQYMLTLAVSAT
jgi:hypothetical protein